MNRRVHFSPDADPHDRAAAEWVARRDRGLTATEQDEFTQWLAADPRNRAAWAEHKWSWEELDRLAGLPATCSTTPNPDLLVPRTRGWPVIRRKPGALAAFGAIAVAFLLTLIGARWWLAAPAALNDDILPALPLISQQSLADGSEVKLNREAIVTVHFTSRERRVRLERGEAHFEVVKDPSRPFVVEVSGVDVRAVGTAFNVRYLPSVVDVLVTSGQVVVQPVARALGALGARLVPVPPEMRLDVGDCASVPLEAGAALPTVQRLSSPEIEARLSWQPRRLEFTQTSLEEIVAAFNRRNPVRLTLANEELATLRLSLTFRSDNVEGFVRLLVSSFGVRAERGEPDEILLYAAVPQSNLSQRGELSRQEK